MRRQPPGAGQVVPRWLLVPAAAGALLIVLPLAALVLRAQWSELPALLTSESALAALWLSLRTAATATLLCVLLGVPMAVLLARSRFRGLAAVRSMVLIPLVLPPVVGGIALLYTFGRQGLLGGVLEILGIQIAYSTAAVVLAQTFVALPFLVLSVETAVRGLQNEVIEAAIVDGAGPSALLRHIVLPLVRSSLLTGAILAFARSLGEFGATIAFAGSLQGVTRTLPLEVYLQRETDPDAAVALALVLVVLAIAVMALAAGRRSPAG